MSNPDKGTPKSSLAAGAAAEAPTKWLNRNVFGMGLTSLLADMNYEMALSILPFFIIFTAGGSPAIVGLVEGGADMASSFSKSYFGYYSDKLGKRTPLMYLGYLATAVFMPAIGFTTMWVQVLVLKVGAWIGRGARSPPRDALMVESVPKGTEGKAFGLQEGMDTVGATIGPLIALLLLPYLPYSKIFFVSFVPGIIAVGVAVLLIRDRPQKTLSKTNEERWKSVESFGKSVRVLSRRFKLLLLSVGIFGISNFSNLIFSLRAEQVFQPSLGVTSATQVALAFYIFLNVIYAAFSYPAGYLADRVPKKNLLAAGYSIFALACIASVFETPDYASLAVIFTFAGLSSGIVNTVERAFASEMVDPAMKGTGYGVLQTVNGVGDFISSTMVGILLTAVSPAFGFGVMASLALFASATLFILLR